MDSEGNKFTFSSNAPIGFESCRIGDSNEMQPTKDFGTNTLPAPACADVSTEPRERKETATQTVSAPHSKKFATYDDSKLVSFIRKVQPIMEEELSYGITPLFDCNDNHYEPTERYRVCRHQELNLRHPNPMVHETKPEPIAAGAATWLSILTRDAPLLALACSPYHEAWCEHFISLITVFSPQRDRNGLSVRWDELCSTPVRACIESLETNPFNRDMFAGGTASGDVYIWQYEQGARNERNALTELYSETTDCGTVVDMAWTRYNVMSKSDSALLTAHSEGTVILWRVGKHIVKDKMFKLSVSSHVGTGCMVLLRKILATSNTEFVAGFDDGALLLCSTTQLIPMGATGASFAGGNTTNGSSDRFVVPGVNGPPGSSTPAKVNCFSPGTIELKGHTFAVTSLQKVAPNGRQELLISCDLAGEVFFHDITDSINSSPAVIIKMPLPFKTHLVCTNDTEFIFAPTRNGQLELYRIGTGKVDTVEPSIPLTGTPNLIKMSANGKWLVTGTYNGTFIIYSVAS